MHNDLQKMHNDLKKMHNDLQIVGIFHMGYRTNVSVYIFYKLVYLKILIYCKVKNKTNIFCLQL